MCVIYVIVIGFGLENSLKGPFRNADVKTILSQKEEFLCTEALISLEFLCLDSEWGGPNAKKHNQVASRGLRTMRTDPWRRGTAQGF